MHNKREIVTSLAGFCTGMAFLAALPNVSAQLTFTVVSPEGSSSILNGLATESGPGRGTAANPISVRSSVSGTGAGWLGFSGIAKMGPVASPLYRNSAWIEVNLKNDSQIAWKSFDLSVSLLRDKPGTSADGMSFGALSERTVSKFDPNAKSLNDLTVNPWNFRGTVGERPLEVSGWDPNNRTPGGVVNAHRLGFALALGDSVGIGEEISILFLISQNWTSDVGFMKFSIVPVPEVPCAGIASALALGAFALFRRLRG